MNFSSAAKRVVLVSAMLGTLMSGYLSYQNYFGEGCKKAFLSCGVGNTKVLIIGQPTCIYGFFMFLLTMILVMIAWVKTEAKRIVLATLIVTTIGVLFSGFLAFYEIVVLKALAAGTMPACVYGLIFYIAAWIPTFQTWRKKTPAVMPPMASTPTV